MVQPDPPASIPLTNAAGIQESSAQMTVSTQKPPPKNPPFWTHLRRRLTDAGLVLVVPPLLFVFQHLPPAWTQALFQGLAPLALLSRKARARALQNLQTALSVSEGEAERLLTASLVRLGTQLSLVLHAQPTQDWLEHNIRLEGLEHLLTPLRQGRSVLLLTGHVGDWELFGARLGLALLSEGFSLQVVYRALRQPRLNALLTQARNRLHIGLLERGRDARFPALRERLRAGGGQGPEVVAMLVDHDTRAPGMMVPFFGRPAHTVSGPALLALQTGVPVVTGFCLRDADGRSRVTLDPFPLSPFPVSDVEPPDLEAQVRQFLLALNARIEGAIRRDPTGWTWMHARWKSTSRRWRQE